MFAIHHCRFLRNFANNTVATNSTPAIKSFEASIFCKISEKDVSSPSMFADDPASINTSAPGAIPINVHQKYPDHFARKIPAI